MKLRLPARRGHLAALSLAILAILASLYSCAPSGADISEAVEGYFASPYKITGSLVFNDEKYDVAVTSSGLDPGGSIKDFRVEFLSGDATKGLCVEFMPDGMYLLFDDMRFKTNVDTFTQLSALSDACRLLALPYVKKTLESVSEANGIPVVEISAPGADGGAAYLCCSKSNFTPLRLHTSLNASGIVLNITRFETVV